MKTELGRKQNETNDRFVKVWNSIGEYVSLDEASRAVDDAAAEVLRVTHGKRVGIYDIDRTIIERAARYIPTAAQFLNSKTRI